MVFLVDYMFIIDRRYRSTYLKDTNIPLFLCSFQYRNNIAFLPYNLGSRLCNELYILNIENRELNSFPITDLKDSHIIKNINYEVLRCAKDIFIYITLNYFYKITQLLLFIVKISLRMDIIIVHFYLVKCSLDNQLLMIY